MRCLVRMVVPSDCKNTARKPSLKACRSVLTHLENQLTLEQACKSTDFAHVAREARDRSLASIRLTSLSRLDFNDNAAIVFAGSGLDLHGELLMLERIAQFGHD